MNIRRCFSKSAFAIILAGTLAGCGEPRAVLLPLQYPDGSPVTTRNGDPLMAGYQTYGSAVHANATALYESAKPPTCATCAHVGMVVTEPSVLRQATGVLEASTLGAGSVMTGVGIMDNVPNSSITQNTYSTTDSASQHGGGHWDGDRRHPQFDDNHDPDRRPGLSPYARAGWGQEPSDYNYRSY